MRRPELLAPAGSMETFYAAVHAGADAVYVGGTRFGARAYAANFSGEELLSVLDYAHRCGRRVYLTLNTLVKEDEFSELYAFLAPLYEAGMDAVLVQDLGVLRYIREQFPEMPVHASTQMTVTGVDGARFLKKHGVQRIVPARELSIQEIRRIREQAEIEVETFIHGAMCYCYSGQCLMSSMLGGRSGNRGRCAQPCRLPYELYREDERVSRADAPYLLSLRDLCTLDDLPELLQAGIDSFKIEGRMKNEIYVAAAVSVYRRCLDRCLEHPDEPYRAAQEDRDLLADCFNRGGFSHGYYDMHNGKELMSEKKNGHQGLWIGTVEAKKGDSIVVSLRKDLHKGDRVEIDTGAEPVALTAPAEEKADRRVSLKARELRRIRDGQKLFRIENQELVKTMREQYLDRPAGIPVEIIGCFHAGEPAELILKKDPHSVRVQGAVVEKAENAPVTAEQLNGLLRKTGGAGYRAVSCWIDADPDIFLPVREIKELRRRGLALLDEKIRDACRRPHVPDCFPKTKRHCAEEAPAQAELSVSIYQARFLSAVLDTPEISRVNIDYSLFDMDRWADAAVRAHEHGKKIFCILPRVMRDETGMQRSEMEQIFRRADIDGLVVGSVDAFAFARDRLGWEKEIEGDAFLYQYNQSAVDFFHCPGVLPLELNRKELSRLRFIAPTMIVYGYVPLMITAGCLKKNAGLCDRRKELLFLKDRYRRRFPVWNDCSGCHNVIYNAEPLYLLDLWDEIAPLGCRGYQARLTVEDTGRADEIIQDMVRVCRYGEPPRHLPEHFTRGHWKRGIE